MDACTFGTDSDSIQSIIGLLLTFTPIKSPSLAYTPKGREGFFVFTKRPCLEWLQYLWPGEVLSVRCWSLWRQRTVKECDEMNLYPIKHQQKHHISEKTCPPMIDLIYNNLMNVNNKSDHEAVQGEGRGYPRPIEIPLYHKYMYIYASIYRSVSNKKWDLFLLLVEFFWWKLIVLVVVFFFQILMHLFICTIFNDT